MRDWLARRRDYEILSLFLVWLVVGLFLGGALSTVIPGAATKLGTSSYRMTDLGVGIILTVMLLPPLIAVLVRNRALARSRAEDARPLPPGHAMTPGRFAYHFWRSGCGTLILVAIWLAAAPFVLWFYAFQAVRVDPLVTAHALSSPWVWGGLAILLFPIVALVVRWVRARGRASHELDRLVPKTAPLRGGEAVVSRVFGGLLMAIGCAILVGGVFHGRDAVRRRVTAWESARWPSTSSVILWSEFVADHMGPRANIRYEYVVNGVLYRGSRVTPLDVDRPAPPTAKEASERTRVATGRVEKYPRGKPVRVFYDPDNVRFSVLEPGLTIVDIGMGVLFTLAWAGFALVWFIVGSLFGRAQTALLLMLAFSLGAGPRSATAQEGSVSHLFPRSAAD